MARYDYHRPATLDDALSRVSSTEGARWVSGGTDLLVQIRAGALSPSALVSLRGIPELSGIELGDRARIGAATTLAEIVEHGDLAQRYPLLVQAARGVGSPQIRNVATIGGNLCNASPCADTAPALLVLGAVLCLRGPDGQRRVPASDFFLGPGQTCLAPGELLVAIELPAPAPGARGRFTRQTRVGMDLAKVSVAVQVLLRGLRCESALVAVGSVAPVPLRLRATEALLEGATLDLDVLAAASRQASLEVSPIDDLRSSQAYRRRMVGVLLARSLRALMQAEAP